jgi:bilirubin oxidase
MPKCYSYLPAAFLLAATTSAQNPLAIPPLLDQDTFQLVLDEGTREFYPGIVTNTYGISAPFLGPALVLHQGDTARFHVVNQLAEVSGMHWNGLDVPPEFDGSPPRMLMPGESWDVKYKVLDKAGMYTYHPHTMGTIGAQVNKGAAGLLIIQDDEEAQLPLPRTWGVDDFPVVVQDKKFSPAGQFIFAPYGDSILVNGTPHPYLNCPAQVVRLRLANASTARYYAFGFQDNRSFQVIGSEGGLLSAPVEMTRLTLGSGERAELLLDLNGMEGDSLLLMSFGSELPQTVPGSNNLLWESSWLNGIDFPILRIRVSAPTADPVTAVPATLVDVQPWPEASATRTRVKEITGMGMVNGMGNFKINGTTWNMDVVNDTILLGSTEIWTWMNHSNMAHPMTMHGGSFYVLDRNGAPPPAWERGPKSVVNVDVGDTVRTIMRFASYTTGDWPLMYHCHNLMHIDQMMWQFIIVDPDLSVHTTDQRTNVLVYPVPASSELRYEASFPVTQWRILDLSGREILRGTCPKADAGLIDLAPLAPGNYLAVLEGSGNRTQARVMRQ